MGLCSELGIDEGMNREQIVKQLFSARKKWGLRQNGSDMQKRQEAETILDVISSLQNAIDKSVDAFPGVQLLVQTYGFLYDNDMLNNEAKLSIEAAASGSGDDAGQVGAFFMEIGQIELEKPWVFWAADCGFVNVYQVCGYFLMDSDPDAAIEWFEKAVSANVISAPNFYNWGLIYFRKGLYTQAKERFEISEARGEALASFALGDMYENGYGTVQDLEMALQKYQLAEQRGCQGVQVGIIRVTNQLNRSRNQQQNNPSKSSQNVQQATQQKKSKPTGQPIVAYEIKSDKKSIIPWNKILIVLYICLVIVSLLFSCADYRSRAARKRISGKNVQEMMQMQEEAWEERDESEEKVLTDDTEETPAVIEG